MKYAIVVTALSKEDGGGFMASVPDLYGCQSDGETPEEAIQNVQLAIDEWIECQKEAGREIPKPGTAARRSMEDRKRLVNAIKALSEGYEGFEQRLEMIEASLEEMREEVVNVEAWHRFASITGVHVEKHEKLQA